METNSDQVLFCLMLGFCISYMLIPKIIEIWQGRLTFNRPTDFHHAHTSHHAPVPRLGGLVFAIAFVVIYLLPTDALFGFKFSSDSMIERWTLFCSALAMFGLGFWDDLRGLGARYKLAGQLIIASIAYWGGLGIYEFKIPLTDHFVHLGLWAWPITVMWLVAMTNLINLIDGVDGLAGGICLMLMILMVVVGNNNHSVPMVAETMAGALLGFLLYNFPPARIYLGDGGAYFLGFLIGGLSLYSSQKGTIIAALIAPLFVLALPVLDTSLAIVRRGLQGLPLFRPDRKHIHHRLLQSGISRRDVVLGAYAFTAIFLALGLVFFWWRQQYFPIVFGVATLTIIASAYGFSFSRKWFSVGNALKKSLHSREEIQYALTQISWLTLEGTRARNPENLCRDTAFIARKLGFSKLRVRLFGSEQTWDLTSALNNNLAPLPQVTLGEEVITFRHVLPEHPESHIELEAFASATSTEKTSKDGMNKLPDVDRENLESYSKFEILGEILAEGWAKAIANWQKNNQRTARL